MGRPRRRAESGAKRDVNGAVVVLRNVKVPSVAKPGSLPVPPEVWRMMLVPSRTVCLPRDHDSVSENCDWRPNRLETRDCPIVKGTEPERV